MSATSVGADPFEFEFPARYDVKAFIKDAVRVRDIHKLSTREKLTDGEVAEVAELRRRLKRADGDQVLMFLLRSREHGGFSLL